MGTNDAFSDDKAERIYGNHRATGNKQARLKVSVDAFPYCEKQPSVVKFAAGQQTQGLASILQHPLGTRNPDPQIDSHWRRLFPRTAPLPGEANPNRFFEDSDGKTGDGRTVNVHGTAGDPATYAVLLAVQNLDLQTGTTMNQPRTHSLSHGNRESRSPSNDRPRSRAISIKRTPKANVNMDDLDEIPGSSDRMYDWATWRMYNRIIDHRQKYAVKLNEDTTSIDTSQTSQFDSPHWNRSSDNGNLLAYESAYPMPTQHSEYSQEDEVFEFDP